MAITENSRAQRSAYPNPAPARVQVVTVPGPMNAAVTRAAGPMLRSRDFVFVMLPLVKIAKWRWGGCAVR